MKEISQSNATFNQENSVYIKVLCAYIPVVAVGLSPRAPGPGTVGKRRVTDSVAAGNYDRCSH